MIEQIIVESDRDMRVLTWLKTQVTDDALSLACQGLAGNRRLYVSNLCKQLGLTPPKILEATDRATALKHLEQIRSMLHMQREKPQ